MVSNQKQRIHQETKPSGGKKRNKKISQTYLYEIKLGITKNLGLISYVFQNQPNETKVYTTQ